jgi:kynureninase
MTHQQSTKCVITLSTVITLQHVLITFLENNRLVRELVNMGQNVANALYIVQRVRKSLQRFKRSLQ